MESLPLRLNIIGAGKVARTLGKLWADACVFRISGVVNRTIESAERAVAFIGAGGAVSDLENLPEADIYLLGVSDSTIQETCDRLVSTGKVSAGKMVFHLSGGMSSEILDSAAKCGAMVASFHPVKTFVDSAIAVEKFTGTYCSMEGHEELCQILSDACSRIGGKPVALGRQEKLVYHASYVFVCNYLAALMELGIQSSMHAGIERGQALAMMESIVRETVENIFRVGPADALTGPIARGDLHFIKNQINALQLWRDDYAEIYRHLGLVAVELAERKGAIDADTQMKMKALLQQVPAR